MGIPVIDLTDALSPGAPRNAEVAEQLRAACRSAGFFYAINHGVPEEMVHRQFEAARALFDEVPAETKQRLAIKNARGYEGLGQQTLDATAKPDLKESFYAGVEYADDHPYVQAGYHTYGANRWPEQLPWVKEQSEAYIKRMHALAIRIMQLMAISLDLPENYFDGVHDSPMVTLRMIRYPAHPKDADERTFGAGTHTDWGAITMLAQDSTGGLEVQMPNGEWVDATPIEGSFVINLGDMIPRWTNGHYHSNPHRVRNRFSNGKPRFSVPTFYSPDYRAKVEPVPGTVPEGEKPKFEACLVGEHIRELYQKSFGLSKAS